MPVTSQFDQFVEDFLAAGSDQRISLASRLIDSMEPAEFCFQTISFLLENVLSKLGITALVVSPFVRGDDSYSYPAKPFCVTRNKHESHQDLFAASIAPLQDLSRTKPIRATALDPASIFQIITEPNRHPVAFCQFTLSHLLTNTFYPKGLDAMAVIPFLWHVIEQPPKAENAFFLGETSPLSEEENLALAINDVIRASDPQSTEHFRPDV